MHPDRAVGAKLSMCLAKMGRAARWTSIGDDLALPTSHAHRIEGLLPYIQGTPIGPTSSPASNGS